MESLCSQGALSIENTLHPVVSKPLTELDTRNPYLISNDLLQEAFATRNQKLEYLIKKFILPNTNFISSTSINTNSSFNTSKNNNKNSSDTFRKLIENLIKIYTHENGLFSNINKVLREGRKNTFLSTTIILLNDAIRSNFSDTRYEAKCYRKANLKQEEFDFYFKLFSNTQKKSFCWKSFVSATKSLQADTRNKIDFDSVYEGGTNNFNTIFTIEFSSDSWGLDVSQFSLSKNQQDEILLPANSVFEIVKINQDEKDQIIHIGLVKLDRNIKSRASVSRTGNLSNANTWVSNSNLNNTWISKGSKIIEKEIVLLQNDLLLPDNALKYCFVQDEDNLFKIKFAISGPPQTPYSGGVFQFNISIPEGYPNKTPSIKFATKVYHPNISFESGVLDEEVVEYIWRPSLSIAKLINIIYNLLAVPNENFGRSNTNTVQKKEFNEDRQRFEFNAVEVTRRFASFKGVIAEMQRKNNLTDLEARTELLKRNAFETIV